jgi:hypothetical protein
MNVERGSNWVTISSSPREAAAKRRTSAGPNRSRRSSESRLPVTAADTGWLKNLLAAIEIFVVLLPVCALLYVYWVPLTSSPVRDADGNPRFR